MRVLPPDRPCCREGRRGQRWERDEGHAGGELAEITAADADADMVRAVWRRSCVKERGIAAAKQHAPP